MTNDNGTQNLIYTWSKHEDDGVWTNATFGTEAECIRDAAESGESGVIYIGECTDPYSPCPDVDSMLERLEEDAYEEYGEVTEGWQPLDTKNHEAEYERLVAAVTDAVNTYLAETNQTPDFYHIRNIREVVMP